MTFPKNARPWWHVDTADETTEAKDLASDLFGPTGHRFTAPIDPAASPGTDEADPDLEREQIRQFFTSTPDGTAA